MDRLNNVGASGRLAVSLFIRVAQKQSNVFVRDAQVAFVHEQVVEGLDVLLGEFSRLDLLIGIVIDADQHDMRLRRVGCGLLLSGTGPKSRRRHQHQNCQRTLQHYLDLVHE